jgi:hypothetical protein
VDTAQPSAAVAWVFAFGLLLTLVPVFFGLTECTSRSCRNTVSWVTVVLAVGGALLSALSIRDATWRHRRPALAVTTSLFALAAGVAVVMLRAAALPN